MNPPPRLIVRADDAGCARSANAAILDTIERGIVRNVSVMGCGPEVAHAAELLAGLPGVCFGLHATVNAEWARPRWRPVLPTGRVRSLVDREGVFLPHPRDLHARGFDILELESEIFAQLERLRRAGFRVSYLDTHMGFDWLPGARNMLARLAAGEGLVFDTAESHPRVARPRGAWRIAARIGLVIAPGPQVLITHPGRLGGDMDTFGVPGSKHGKVARSRDRERRELCGPAARRALEEGGIVLARYADHPRRAAALTAS